MEATASANHARLSFLDAAERLLIQAGIPLTPDEITEQAIADGLLRTSGKTPQQTMKGKLATDVLSRKDKSRFKRTAPNTFGLREWKHIPEFVADRFQKALMDEDIIVFDRKILRQFFPHDGITTLDADSGLRLIAETYEMRRSDAEQNFDVVQLVSQFLVLHKKRIATHKRTRRLPESRLHGVWSMLFGGHLNSNDVGPLFGPFDPVNGAHGITRELSEEVRIRGRRPSLQLVGGIYDPRREVSTQHLGVLYVVRVDDDSEIEIGERGFLQQLTFERVSELKARINNFENWSELVFRSMLLNERIVP